MIFGQTIAVTLSNVLCNSMQERDFQMVKRRVYVCGFG